MGFLRRLFGGGNAPDPRAWPSTSRPTAPPAPAWAPPGPITSWPGDEFEGQMGAYLFPPVGRKRVDVVGESHYQGTLQRIGGGRTTDGTRDPDHTAALLPEPTNPYDPNAVRVVILASHAAQKSGKVGYLSRENAVTYRPIIDRLAAYGKVTVCRASLKGGWDRGPGDRGSIGVDLHMGTVADCEAEMAKDPPKASWE